MKKFIAVLMSSLAVATAAATSGPQTAAALAARIAPSVADNIIFETIESPVDTFAISARDGKVLIEGNNSISMAVGFNNYLRRWLGTNVSWYDSEPVQVPDKIAIPDTTYGARAHSATRCHTGSGLNGSDSSTGWLSTASTCPSP